MISVRKYPKNRVNLKGAVQINRNSFFVCTDEGGKTFLKTGRDAKVQKNMLKNMIALNPAIKSILKKYKLKPEIHLKTLRELTSGHMNETCNIAMGVYSILSESKNIGIDRNTLPEVK